MRETEGQKIAARVAAQSLALHALLDLLRRRGVLNGGDLQEMKSFCLAIADDLEAQSSTFAQVGGAQTHEEVQSFVAALDGCA